MADLTTDRPMRFEPYEDGPEGWWSIIIPEREAMEESREPWRVVGRRLNLSPWEVEELRALLAGYGNVEGEK
jgi:hypothetical protein